jgi:sugar/nucleoside kinase (ribokinase family)
MTGSPHAEGCDVVVVGEYYWDLIFTGLPEVPRLGADLFARGFGMLPGASFTTAMALHRLGLRTVWAADFGTDLFSRLALEAAQAEGLDDRLFRRLDQPLERVSASFSFAHDRGFVSYAVRDDLPPAPEVLDAVAPRALLLQSFRLEPELLALARAARQRGILVCLDCQHVAHRIDTPGVAELFREVDVFLPNESEAIGFTGEATAEAAMARLATMVPTVLVKRGAAGAIGVSRGRRCSVAAPAVAVVDTTGAGDSFNAGFLYGRLRGCDFRDSVALAVACGTLATTGHGGSALPDEDGLLAMVRHEAAAST